MAAIEPVVLGTSNEVEVELSKISHILIETGFTARFGIASASKLPILMQGTTVQVSEPNKLCFYGFPPAEFAPERAPSGKQPGDYSVHEIQCMETAAHQKRLDACLTANATQRQALFQAAYDAYESTMQAFGVSSIATTAAEVRKNKQDNKVTILTPSNDFLRYSIEVRRIVSHCCAGMALCLLMGRRDPMRFFKASSAALCWEPSRPLELAAVLRKHLLLMASFTLGVRTMMEGGMLLQIDSAESLDALFDEETTKIVGVYTKFNEVIVLPLVHRIGTPAMQRNELDLIAPNRREAALRAAGHLNERHAARLSGAIPDPRAGGPAITTHATADGQTIERTCGRCGLWDRGDTRFKKCSRCERAYYCSKECQTAAWPAHRSACAETKKQK
jgi:hypothetical protein